MKKTYKYIYDIADEIFDQIKSNEYVNSKSMKKNDLLINEITFLSKTNPYNKQPGTYCSFTFDNIDDEKKYRRLKRYLTAYISSFINELTKKEKPSILFVGLGNENYLPDSIGPKIVKNINSNYFFKKQIGCLIPQVMAITGMETSDIIKGVLKYHQYDLVIAIDSLATSSIKRLNKTIQITDAGIQPGSGVNNYRKVINKEELKTPVLVIGLATVIPYNKIIDEFINENHLDAKQYQGNDLVLTTKEIEHQIDYISLLLSEVINQIIK